MACEVTMRGEKSQQLENDFNDDQKKDTSLR